MGKICANCGEPVTGRAGPAGRGADLAWMAMCRPCAELWTDGMDVVVDRPGGQHIQILRCTDCGRTRACRPRWRTRCHVCLDERTDPALSEQVVKASDVRRDPAFTPDVQDDIRDLMGLANGADLEDWAVHQYLNLAAEFGVFDEFERPGWTVLAADICGHAVVTRPRVAGVARHVGPPRRLRLHSEDGTRPHRVPDLPPGGGVAHVPCEEG